MLTALARNLHAMLLAPELHNATVRTKAGRFASTQAIRNPFSLDQAHRNLQDAPKQGPNPR
jgi:hypothetical protein